MYLRILLFIALLSQPMAHAGEPSPLVYRTSWVGNTFGGAENTFVQMDSRTLFVTPDGTCFTNVSWEEGGHNAAIYKDGKLVANPGSTHGWGNGGGLAVVANDKYIYISQKKDSEGGHLHDKDPNSYPVGNKLWFGLTRRTRDSNGTQVAPFEGGVGSGKEIVGLGTDVNAVPLRSWLVVNEVPVTIGEEAQLRGLALDGRGRLYVGNPFNREILIYDEEKMSKVGTWVFEDARQMACAPDGTLWVVQARTDHWGRLPGDAPPAKLVHLNVNGERLSETVTEAVSPTGLAFDGAGRLLVADNGPDQQIKIFDVSGKSPVLVDTFGAKGGIFSGVQGRVEPLKFNGPQGVGCDLAGNIYVGGNGWGGNGSGFTLESYKVTGDRNWALHGLLFCDRGDFDPTTDGQNIYTSRHHFKVDLKQNAPGSEWTHAGFTLNPFKYPKDGRYMRDSHSVWLRVLAGKRFIFDTTMYSSYVQIYRLRDEDEVAIPSGRIERGHDQTPQNIWIDRNGNGQEEVEEVDRATGPDPVTWAWWVDSRGDIWQAYQDGSAIIRFPFQGLTEHGVPDYTRAAATREPAPAPFDRYAEGSKVERVLYVPETDVMYITGYTPRWPNPGRAWKDCGRAFVRYDHWSDASRRVKTWEIEYPGYVYNENPWNARNPASMCVAGEYLFTVEGTTGVVKILDARTGVVLGEMKPGAEVGGRIGWIDIPYGITAHQRKDGEYLVLLEDNYKSKNLMFRFRTPEAGAPQVVQQVQSSAGEGRVRLSWSGSNDAVAWQVFRSDVSTGPYHAIGTVHGRNNFTDLSADPGVAFFYRVQAVGWGGRSEMSEAVTATASSRRSLLLEDFESVDSAIAGFVVVPMPAPQLDGGGTQVGRASSINWLPEIALPEGASTLVIEYHRLFLKNPEDGCKSHFTRQYVNFNNNGGTRVGQEERYPLTGGDAGKWTHVRWTVPIPPGVTAVMSGELNSLIEDARPEYDNPVYIDEFKVSVE